MDAFISYASANASRAARVARALTIVTGDKAGLLALKQHGVTRLVGVSEMVAALKLR
jgi:hypothetical protein